MEHNERHFPPELADLAKELSSGRPEPTPVELDRIKTTVLARAARPSRRKGSLMKSRLAITAMLVVGFALSGAGAGLAVSGISGSDDAATIQYGTTTTTTTQTTTTETIGAAPQQESLPETLGQEDQGAAPEEGEAPSAEVQPTEQVAVDDGDSLPFTGLAAIPLILVGVGLLTSGFVLRRGTRD